MGVLASDGVLLHFTGQVAWDADENIIGIGDVAEQTRQCFRNIETLLQEAGGTLDHLVSVTTYYTEPSHLPNIQRVRAEFLKSDDPPASTSVMVAGLGSPEFLVELLPVAVIPRDMVKWHRQH